MKGEEKKDERKVEVQGYKGEGKKRAWKAKRMKDERERNGKRT